MAADESSAACVKQVTSENPYPVGQVVLNVGEASADDKELFLKVLENLKNAVSKSDNVESQQPAIVARSEPEKSGTTTVTVSDKTKSLILQKLASEKAANSLEPSSSASLVKNNETIISSVVAQTASLVLNTPVTASNTVVTALPSANNIVFSYHSVGSITNDGNQKNTVSVWSSDGSNVTSVTKSPEKLVTSRPLSQVTLPAQKTPSVQLYPCNICDYYSDNKNYLKQHVVLVHTSDRPYKCPYCDYAGKRSHALREHLIVHTDERPFQCKICNATFRKKGHLTNHVKLHNSKRLVKCPLCKVLVYDVGENGLDAHLKNDHDTERLFGCDLCDHVAANEPDILKHLSQKHKSKLATRKCEKCPFETADNSDFQAHVNAHEMSESNVEIGTKAPTKVIGVATIASNKLQPAIPNATVRFTGNLKPAPDQNIMTDPSNPQSAVIKPVWIKCSVCGFVEQDSEAIKTHMLEHLKDQYGEAYAQQFKSEPVKTTEPIQHNPEPVVTMPVTAPRNERPNIPTPRNPILVPVTNVEQLLPQHAGKIDMNSPILVPVTDPSLLKSLQSQTGIIATKLSPLGNETKVSSVVYSKTADVTSVDVGGINRQILQLAQGTATMAAPLSGIAPVTFQTLPKNANVKVVSVANHPIVQSFASQTSEPITLSSAAVSTGVSVSAPSSSGGLPLLTTIPVPRSLSMIEMPKLPPQFAKLSSEESDSSISRESTSQKQEIEQSNEQKLATLKENLANVQKLIQEQEKISRQVGNSSIIRLDSQGIPEKIDVNGVVYYIEPTEKKNTSITANESFIHDVHAGRFKCTLCGYTCEYQRTIKAHIWKHSGNKNVDYPMFQNGPLSVYEDEALPVRSTKSETNVVPSARNIQMVQSVPMTVTETSSSSKLPSFIVYEKSKTSTVPTQGKISNVAPALANLIVARTMAGMTKDKSDEKLQTETEDEEKDYNDSSFDECKLTIDESETCSDSSVSGKQSVVVEAVDSVANADGYTAIQSQQNSPRVSTRSPDSGWSEMTNCKVDDQTDAVTSHDDSSTTMRSSRKRTQRSSSAADAMTLGDTSTKKAKLEEAREDSAVTLLSLLKKGPNYNPACPPTVQPQSVALYSNASSPGKEDSNSIGDSDVGSGKPKSGISTSLLAVIEQLRERSKSDVDEEKSLPPPPKKQYRRRSRKSSIEDNTPASGIENVEEFVKGGEVKYRCKLCHYTNDSTLLLRQHMKLHKPKQQFECSLCDLIAESSEALQDHMIQHCKVRTYQCKLCTSAFSYKSQLRAHMRMHNDQDILMCDFCDFETRNVQTFRSHLTTHASKLPNKCSICNTEFETAQALKAHKKDSCEQAADKTDKASSNGYACDECEFVSFGRREFKNHQKTHMGKAVQNLPKRCPYCDHSDLTIEMIRKHISKVHGESKPLKCEMCGFFAVSIRSLKSHMKRHVNDQRFVAQPLEQYKCNLCGYVCHHLPSLKSHMWRHAADQHYSYWFTNDIINAAIDFDSLTDVTETTDIHVEKFRILIIEKMKVNGLEHTRETLEESAKTCCWVTFRCCQCGFETINKAELNKHMTAHTDIIKKTLEVSEETDGGPQSQDESLSS